MTLKSFDILSCDVSVHCSRVIEASAGTGKTFAIENLVLRWLIEDDPSTGEPLLLEQILAVTFTKAAARDLKKRVRSNLDKALQLLTSDHPLSAPPFIRKILEQGPEVVQRAARRLEYALATFDQAQIFTIHGFCARALVEHHLDGLAGHTAEELSPALLNRIVKDFLRTEVRSERISPLQLKEVIGKFQGDEENFQRSLLDQAKKALPIQAPPDFSVYLQRFQEAMGRLKSRGWIPEHLLADWEAINSRVRNKVDLRASGEQWIALLAKNCWTVADFDSLLLNERFMDKVMAPEAPELKKNAQLHYPEWVDCVRHELFAILTESIDGNRIFAWLASHCQQMVNRVLQEEEIRGPDRLLADMALAVDDPAFVQKVRQPYRAAVVDEFQDTDPQQWAILKKLFPDSSGAYLTVVGDPKQSIYAFRQADIYTYREAAQTFPEQGRLSTNYRSQPGLVHGLNTLFACPGFIALPKSNTQLDSGAVDAAPQAASHRFQDHRSPVHFFIAQGSVSGSASFPNDEFEQTFLYPTLAQEIARLHTEEKFQWKQISVLVRDRHQGKAFLNHLKKWNIPAATQRSDSLLDSPSLPALIDVMEAFLDPRDKSPLRSVLGGPLIGWNHLQLKEWVGNRLPNKDLLLLQTQQLHNLLVEKDFATFFEAFLQSRWPETTVLDGILKREDGRMLYRDLRQLGDLITKTQAEEHLSAQGVLQWLTQLPECASSEDDQFKVWDDPALDAVRIMTIHYSKGLEFDIVFALGLIRRRAQNDKIIPDGNGLHAAVEGSASHTNYQREGDAEKARLTYVALTRAKIRVYIPLLFGHQLKESQKAKQGTASPIELLTARLGQPYLDERALYDRINSETLVSELTEFFERSGISYEYTKDITINPIISTEIVQLIEPTAFKPSFPSILTHSFTSMSQKTALEELHGASAPNDYNNPTKTPHTLPAGKNIGIALHSIFERIPFDSVHSPIDVDPYVPTWLGEWTSVLSQLVYHTLHTPLDLHTGLFPLCDLAPAAKLIEWEFMIPAQDGFIKGFVDLIFEHKGFYYLVDWKSNWLGPDGESYTQPHLEAVMQAENYDLQMMIYTEALRRYLEKTETRPFEECFGGAFYLFSRGMTEGQGVYFVPNPCKAAVH